MHKVELRLTNEEDAPAANFEVFTETLKDGNYVELAPMRVIASGGSPVVQFLEDNERVVIVAKTNTNRVVFDKEQNANVRVETDEEKSRREERGAAIAKSGADQAVRSAQAQAGTVKEQNAKAQNDADAAVRQAERDRAAVKSLASASSPASKPTGAGTSTTSPVDSKQVKKDA